MTGMVNRVIRDQNTLNFLYEIAGYGLVIMVRCTDMPNHTQEH